CQSNLRQLGQALLLFANENKGKYPAVKHDPTKPAVTAYTGSEAGDPAATDGPEPNDVTAAMFLLLRTQDITSKVFVCPSSAAQTWNYGGGENSALNRSNFPSRRYLSYSYANPYPSQAAIDAGYKLNNALSAEFVVMADMNPGSEALLKLTT